MSLSVTVSLNARSAMKEIYAKFGAPPNVGKRTHLKQRRPRRPSSLFDALIRKLRPDTLCPAKAFAIPTH